MILVMNHEYVAMHRYHTYTASPTKSEEELPLSIPKYGSYQEQRPHNNYYYAGMLTSTTIGHNHHVMWCDIYYLNCETLMSHAYMHKYSTGSDETHYKAGP